MGTGPRSAVGSVLAATALILAAGVPAAHGEIERPHALAFKVGYHVYPNSSYFVVTQDNFIGGTQDFQGQGLEIFDYSYQWPSRWSLNLSLLGGYYQEFVPTQTSQHAIFVHTMTVTPVYRISGSDAIGKWQVYGGVGLGRYGMSTRFDFPDGSTTDVNTYTLGYQALLGAEYRYNEQTGFVIEEKYSRARIRFDSTLLTTQVDVGGHNILVGVRIHF